MPFRSEFLSLLRVCHLATALALLAGLCIAPPTLAQSAETDAPVSPTPESAAADSDAASGDADGNDSDSADARADEREPFPSFQVRDEVNRPLDSRTWIGDKPVLVDFWATWCGPCRFTMPQIQKIHEDYGDDLDVIGISVDSGMGGGFRARNWATEKGITYELVHDMMAEGRKALGIDVLPVLVLVDTEGRIVTDWWGEPDFDDVRATIEKTLTESAGSD